VFFINKNKILLILIVIFIILLILNAIKINIQSKKAIQVVSLPVTGKTIILDAGHGNPDERSRKQKWSIRRGYKFKNS